MKILILAIAILGVSSVALGNDRAAMYAGALDNMEKTHKFIMAMQVPAGSCIAEIERGERVGEASACAVFRKISPERLEMTRSAMAELHAACDNMQSLYDDRAMEERCEALARDSDALFADLDRIHHWNSE